MVKEPVGSLNKVALVMPDGDEVDVYDRADIVCNYMAMHPKNPIVVRTAVADR